jgi:cobalt/nickel transport system permease protein
MTPLPDWLTSETTTPLPPSRRHRGNWLDETQAGVAEFLRTDLFSEQYARNPGLLQKMDARAKLISGLLLLVLTSFLREPLGLLLVLGGVLFLALLSRIPLRDLIGRKGPVVLWTGLLPALPAMFWFVSPGELLVPGLGITRPGLAAALLLFLRVAVSASIGFLLLLSTSWQDLLSGLRKLGLPRDIVTMLGMMERYLALLVAGVEDRLWAKQSRTIRPDKAREARGWIASEIGMLWHHAASLGEEVFLAMKARGYGSK